MTTRDQRWQLIIRERLSLIRRLSNFWKRFSLSRHHCRTASYWSCATWTWKHEKKRYWLNTDSFHTWSSAIGRYQIRMLHETRLLNRIQCFQFFISTDLIFQFKSLIFRSIHRRSTKNTFISFDRISSQKILSDLVKRFRNSLAITSYSTILRVSSRDDFVIFLEKYIRREMNSLRCAGLWWILCSRFWRKWWQTCLLWFFSTSDVKVTTLTIQASTTWIRPLDTSLHQWNLHRFSSHVRKKKWQNEFSSLYLSSKIPSSSSRM